MHCNISVDSVQTRSIGGGKMQVSKPLSVMVVVLRNLVSIFNPGLPATAEQSQISFFRQGGAVPGATHHEQPEWNP
jgi:hypothetical protein